MHYSFRLAELLGHLPDPRKRPGTIKAIVEHTGLDRHQVAALLKNEVKYIPLRSLVAAVQLLDRARACDGRPVARGLVRHRTGGFLGAPGATQAAGDLPGGAARCGGRPYGSIVRPFVRFDPAGGLVEWRDDAGGDGQAAGSGAREEDFGGRKNPQSRPHRAVAGVESRAGRRSGGDAASGCGLRNVRRQERRQVARLFG